MIECLLGSALAKYSIALCTKCPIATVVSRQFIYYTTDAARLVEILYVKSLEKVYQ